MSGLANHIKSACAAKANLHVFSAIVGALESGSISGGGSAETTANKIIKLCKEETRRQLWAMDAAIEAANSIKGDA